MVKIFIAILLTVIVFTGALYTGILSMVWDTVTMINSDVLPFIPIELRIWFFFLFLGLFVALGKRFL